MKFKLLNYNGELWFEEDDPDKAEEEKKIFHVDPNGQIAMLMHLPRGVQTTVRSNVYLELKMIADDMER